MSIDNKLLGERIAMSISAVLIASGCIFGKVACDSCDSYRAYDRCVQSQRELYPRGIPIPPEHERQIRENCAPYR